MTITNKIFVYLIPAFAVALFTSLAQADTYKPARLANGQPDFQGVWTNASVTAMERAPGWNQLVIPAEKLEELTSNSFWIRNIREDQGPTDPNEGAFTDGEAWRGYNGFWIDPGSSFSIVKGEYRSSWIIEPANGRIPYSAAGRQLRSDPFPNIAAKVNEFDGPEARPIGDRCIISYAGALGPPLNNQLYNNHYQFVQTDDHLMILAEMNHDVRIINVGGTHNPAAVKPWFGSSIAKWEGDTLVIETVNVHPLQERQGTVPLSPQGKVVEKFTRNSDKTMLYEFEVNDPVYYSQTWKGEMTMVKDDERIYEYACHEGNYALPGILGGARREERAAREGK